MASPNPGRRSYARRAQYGAFAAYVVAITGVIAGLLSAVLWVVDPVGFGNLRLIVAEAAAPAGRLVRGGTGAVGGVDDSIGNWWRAGAQNARLKRENLRHRQAIIRAAGLEAENRQLRALLGITQAGIPPVAVARLLAATPSSTRRTAIVDAGYGDGVRPGQPVRSADGLIGRTLEVGPTVARVLLITDRQNIVPARRARDGLAVLVNGRGDALLEVRALNSAANVLKVGDIILASGSGGLYQPRTPVAFIVRLTGDGALARPIADPARAEAVIIEPAADAAIDQPPPPANAEVEGQRPVRADVAAQGGQP